jgi:hypothetical protein
MPTSTLPLARQRATNDARHLMRYLKFKAGTDPAEIAKQDHVNVKQVKESIRQMEAFESLNSDGQIQLAVRDLIRTTIPKVKETLDGLLAATNTIERPNAKTGGVDRTYEPDKITRLEAVKVFGTLYGSTQPKTPGVAVQVNQHNTQQNATLSAAETTEERMRRLKAAAAQHNLLPPVVTGVPDAIDKGFDPDDERGDDDGEDED